MSGLAERGLAACVEYDECAGEVRRLSGEIAGLECRRGTERLEAALESGARVIEGASCFQLAKADDANWRSGSIEDGPRPPTLAQLAVLVADCPDCARLCELIAARRDARKRFAVAKRRIRSVARAAGRTAHEPEEGQR